MAPRQTTKHSRNVRSRKEQKRLGARGTQNRKQGAGFYTVECSRHGKRPVGEVTAWVRVGLPRNKRQQTSGCPYCRKEGK
jgi:hypothetical protein